MPSDEYNGETNQQEPNSDAGSGWDADAHEGSDDGGSGTQSGNGDWGSSDQEPVSDVAAAPSPQTGRTKGPDEQFCDSCGEIIKQNAEICPECGVTVNPRHASVKPEPSTRLTAALIGGVAGFCIAFFVTPFIGQPIGSGIAGYLRGPDTTEGAITGSLAGVIASVPSVLIIGAIFLVFGLIGATEGAGVFGSFVLIGIVFLVITVGSYAVLGAIGGLIGAAMSDRAEPEQ